MNLNIIIWGICICIFIYMRQSQIIDIESASLFIIVCLFV